MMKHTLMGALAGLGAAVAGVVALAAPAVLFEDQFDGKLADGWAWVREDKDGWRVEGGALRVRAAPGNLWEKENTARNLLLRPVPKGVDGFVVEVTVTNAPAAFGEQAGLLWYRDDDHYVKLTKEFYDGKTWVVLAAERAGKAEYREAECKEETVVLRLTVGADEVVGVFRANEANAGTSVGRLEFKAGGGARDGGGARAGEGDGWRVGLTAHHGPEGAGRWATFRAFRVVAAD